MGKICIAVDAMGGDYGPSITVPAAIQAISDNPDLVLMLVGQQEKIEQVIHKSANNWDKTRLIIKNATEVVAMDELPSYALRIKKDSSMRVSLNLVRDDSAKACVSAGNTGALMAISRFVLKMLPGIDRPAILFPLPSMTGRVHVLDLGANVECQADHLFQFAVMGSVLIAAIEKKAAPRVGLLNIGSEAIKGTEQVKRAANFLTKATDINYIGFIEGDDIYKGSADVVVCDGFVGNVALKASEGLAQMMLSFAKEEFNRNWRTKLVSLISKPILKRLFTRFDTNKYNGGSLLGLQGVVIKSHGSAGVESFTTAIHAAVKEVETNIPDKIKKNVAAKLGNFEVI